jgi:hypothetical protein
MAKLKALGYSDAELQDHEIYTHSLVDSVRSHSPPSLLIQPLILSSVEPRAYRPCLEQGKADPHGVSLFPLLPLFSPPLAPDTILFTASSTRNALLGRNKPSLTDSGIVPMLSVLTTPPFKAPSRRTRRAASSRPSRTSSFLRASSLCMRRFVLLFHCLFPSFLVFDMSFPATGGRQTDS